MRFRKILTERTRRPAFGTGVDIDLENYSEELESLCVREDGDDIGVAESFSRRHPWECGSLVLFQSLSNVIPFATSPLNDPDFDDAGGFSDDVSFE